MKMGWKLVYGSTVVSAPNETRYDERWMSHKLLQKVLLDSLIDIVIRPRHFENTVLGDH